jgi:hypothetical protein
MGRYQRHLYRITRILRLANAIAWGEERNECHGVPGFRAFPGPRKKTARLREP